MICSGGYLWSESQKAVNYIILSYLYRTYDC